MNKDLEKCPNCGCYMEPHTRFDSTDSFKITFYICEVCDWSSAKEHEKISPITDNMTSFFYYSEE